MEYAGSYALFNWKLEDQELGMEYSNLRLIRAFEHGLDSESSEAGFVLIHVDMVKHSGKLVKGAFGALSACGDADRKAFDEGLEMVVKAMVEVNAVMDGEQLHFGGFWVKVVLEIDILCKVCGEKASQTTITASGPSSLASQSNRCFRMGSCTRVLVRSRCLSGARAGPMTAW